jgi:phosphatidylinositol glycan class S
MPADRKGNAASETEKPLPSLAELAARPIKRYPGDGKAPPPESQDSIYIRTLVIFSFWAVVIFLGLPIWWWTTSIYRARLPLQEMVDWAEGKVSLAATPVTEVWRPSADQH